MRHFFQKLWKHKLLIWKRYICRRSPYALYSWRYILPTADNAIRCQRSFSSRVLPELPRFVAMLVVLHQLLWWYLWHGPWAIWRNWRSQSQQTQYAYAVTSIRQLLHLLRLAYGRTVHPAAYYQLVLHRYPHSHTFNFIYSQQLPDWHKVWQPHITEPVQALIRNKRLFAEQMSAAGMNTVPTLSYWQQGTRLTKLPSFEDNTVFCKPVAASRAQGCYTLRITKQECCLITYTETLTAPAVVLRFINENMARQSYLVQPFLHHHSVLDQFLSETASVLATITIRLVSAFSAGEVIFMAANLEVNEGQQRFKLLPINPDNGLLYEHNWQLPLWSQLLRQVQLGHNVLSSVKTLGWDFVISQNQVYCLEVNLNWAVQPMQLPAHGGLLEKFSKLYSSVN